MARVMKREGFKPEEKDENKKSLKERAADVGLELILDFQPKIDDGKKVHKFHYLREAEAFIAAKEAGV